MFSPQRIVSVLGSMYLTVLLLNAQPMSPGTVNRAEGQVALEGQALGRDTDGVAVVAQGQTLQTDRGRAEVLLTPGVFLRIGENSAVKMNAVSGNSVKVELVRGEAIVEVDLVDKSRRLNLMNQGADASLDRSGVYRFSFDDPSIFVYSGKLRVEDDRRGIELNHGEMLHLTGVLKSQKFDRTETNTLYDWSQRRAGFASHVSELTGEALLGLTDSSSFPGGWYWSPWYRSWAFVPKKGYLLTPFGYGLFAPNAPHYLTPSFGDFRS